VEILFRIYAKFLDGGEAALQRLIDAALGHRPEHAQGSVAHLPRLLVLRDSVNVIFLSG